MWFPSIESNYKNEIAQMVDIIAMLDRLKSTADKKLVKEIEKITASFSEKIQKAFENIEPNNEGIKIYNASLENESDTRFDIKYAFTGLVKTCCSSIFLPPFDFTANDVVIDDELEIPYNNMLKESDEFVYSQIGRITIPASMSDMIRKYVIYHKTGRKVTKSNSICSLSTKINAFIDSLEDKENPMIEGIFQKLKCDYKLRVETETETRYASIWRQIYHQYYDYISKIFNTYEKFLRDIRNNFNFCLNYDGDKIPYMDEEFATAIADLFEDQYTHHKKGALIASYPKKSQQNAAIALANKDVLNFCKNHSMYNIPFKIKTPKDKTDPYADGGLYEIWRTFDREFYKFEETFWETDMSDEKHSKALDIVINSGIDSFNNLAKECCDYLRYELERMAELQTLLMQIPDESFIRYLVDCKMIPKQTKKEVKENATDKE
jgi:hypothetical protein